MGVSLNNILGQNAHKPLTACSSSITSPKRKVHSPGSRAGSCPVLPRELASYSDSMPGIKSFQPFQRAVLSGPIYSRCRWRSLDVKEGACMCMLFHDAAASQRPVVEQSPNLRRSLRKNVDIVASNSNRYSKRSIYVTCVVLKSLHCSCARTNRK